MKETLRQLVQNKEVDLATAKNLGFGMKTMPA